MFKNIVILTQLFLCIIPCTAAIAFKLPDTGQNKCYQAVDPYAEIPCAGTDQDGAYSINPMSYTSYSDGTVTDNNTGLMWQKEDDNQTYNWYQATGTYNATYNADPQQNVCGSLTVGGYSDWRLPTKVELMTIFDYSVLYPGPAIMSAYFPNTKASDYWSNTAVHASHSSAWVMDFSEGRTSGDDMSSANYVRCVRGTEATRTLLNNGNGIVTDTRTGLMWQQGEAGQMTWGNAILHCEGLSLGGHADWRLPSVKELDSLMDDTRDHPTINTSYFPDAYSSSYWSSTTQTLLTGTTKWNWTWEVDFGNGWVSFITKDSNHYTRCVRGGEPGTLVNLTIAKNGGGTGSVTADSGTINWSGNTGTASYTFGSQVVLSPNPDASSLLSGWTGGCSGIGVGNCTVTMAGDNTVTATFDLKPVRIAGPTPAYFTTLQGAHDGADNGNTIEAEAGVFAESLTVNKDLIVRGGYDNSYSGNAGYTTLQGELMVQSGSLMVENLVIM